MSFSIKITGLQQFYKKIQKTKDHMDMNKFNEFAGLKFVGWINKNFKDEGTEKKWQPLNLNTIARRRKGKLKGGTRGRKMGRSLARTAPSGSYRILQDTGALRGSIGYIRQGKQGLVGTVKGGKIGEVVKYASIHEDGGTISRSQKLTTSRQNRGYRTIHTRARKAVTHNIKIPQRKILPTDRLAQKMLNEFGNIWVNQIPKLWR